MFDTNGAAAASSRSPCDRLNQARQIIPKNIERDRATPGARSDNPIACGECGGRMAKPFADATFESIALDRIAEGAAHDQTKPTLRFSSALPQDLAALTPGSSATTQGGLKGIGLTQTHRREKFRHAD